jgi:hypothetical protein
MDQPELRCRPAANASVQQAGPVADSCRDETGAGPRTRGSRSALVGQVSRAAVSNNPTKFSRSPCVVAEAGTERAPSGPVNSPCSGR